MDSGADLQERIEGSTLGAGFGDCWIESFRLGTSKYIVGLGKSQFWLFRYNLISDVVDNEI